MRKYKKRHRENTKNKIIVPSHSNNIVECKDKCFE